MYSLAESTQTGLEVYRVTQSHDTQEDCDDTLRTLFQENGADVVIMRRPAMVGRRFIGPNPDYTGWQADTLITFSTPVSPSVKTTGSRHQLKLREATHGEAQAVEQVFRDYQNHYTSNPLFPSGLAEMAYTNQFERGVQSESEIALVCLLEPLAEVTGIALVKTETSGDWTIELAGMLPPYRKKGMYRDFLRLIEDLAAKGRGNSLSITTQATNLAAMRAWVSLGWQVQRTIETWHFVASRHLSCITLEACSHRCAQPTPSDCAPR